MINTYRAEYYFRRTDAPDRCASVQEQVQALLDRPRSPPGKALASTPPNSERMDMDIAANSDR